MGHWNRSHTTALQISERKYLQPQFIFVNLIEMLNSVNYRYFTWAGDKFPHSTEMINNLAAKGRKMVTIVDPHLKKDDNYKVYADAKSRGYYVKNSNGGEYDGWCWPGEFHEIQ